MSDRCDYCRATMIGPSFVASVVYGVRRITFCDRLCCMAYLDDGEPEARDAQRTSHGETTARWRPGIKEWLYVQ